MKNSPEINLGNEVEFAYQVRRALDEQTANLADYPARRLSEARKMAIARKKAEVRVTSAVPTRRLAGGIPNDFNQTSNSFNKHSSWLMRIGIMIPVIAIIIGITALYDNEQQHHIEQLAEIDAAVLMDELPINAYLDHGFDNYLSTQQDL